MEASAPTERARTSATAPEASCPAQTLSHAQVTAQKHNFIPSFELSLITFIIPDVDECALNPNVCLNGLCVNNMGSYSCNCEPGYSVLTTGCTGELLPWIGC